MLVFAAGRRAHGAPGAHRGPVAACKEGPRPSAGSPVFGEPLPEGRAAARLVATELAHCSLTAKSQLKEYSCI